METGHVARMPQDTLWYFGFGSNMKSSTMKARGIDILDATTVKVPSYVLTFDVFGLPYSEPSMASIASYTSPVHVSHGAKFNNPPDVHGVAFLITSKGFKRLIASEGGGVAYKEIVVTGVPLNRDRVSITMYTLMAKYPRRPNAAPSIRYLKLLQEGAEEHNLPEEYREYLRRIPCYACSSDRLNRVGAALFLSLGRTVVFSLAKKIRRSINAEGRCPEWYGTLVLVVYSIMWWWHDYVFAVIFGPGNGGEVQYGSLRLAD